MGSFVGARVKRVEDPAFLTGRGMYVDDLRVPGVLHAAFVRSHFPHARIASIDTSRALEIPGVVAVFTGEDMAAATEPIVMMVPFPDANVQTFHCLAVGTARFVGDPVAMVIADDRYIAEDGCDAVDVTYEPLPAVASFEQATAPDAPRLFDEWDDNIQTRVARTFGDVDGAFSGAARVVRETFHQHRYCAAPMECRGIVASYDPSSGDMTVHAGTQIPHYFRMLVAPLVRQPVHQMHLLPVDIGGSFGLKWCIAREEIAVCAATRALGRPVKWIEDRNENLSAAGQAREESLEVEAAVLDDGTLLGLRVRISLDQGAYSGFPLPAALFMVETAAVLPSCYRVPAYEFEGTVACTNKASYTALRGPWAAETWVRERILDLIARDLDLDPVEIRRRNLLRADELPRKTVTGGTLDITALPLLDRAIESFRYDERRVAQQRARDDGRLVGIGIAVMIEPAGGPPDMVDGFLPGMGDVDEPARVRVEADGTVTVYSGQSPHGQSHKTTFAQLAADELGVRLDQVRVVTGDTRSTPFSLYGTGGSRAASIAGGAISSASRVVRDKVAQMAAVLLEASPDDIEIVDGMVGVRGVPAKAMPLAMIATTAYAAPFTFPDGVRGSLEATVEFPSGGAGSWTGAVHCCEIEIDVNTGRVGIARYLVVEDCGRMINPAIVEGQITGGVAQGIGAVFLERSAYDGEGQFLAGTFMDYLLPTAMDVPRIEIEHMQMDTDNPFNIRGVGEGGMIAAPAAITNAIDDALASLGGRLTEQYLPPARILALAEQIS